MATKFWAKIVVIEYRIEAFDVVAWDLSEPEHGRTSEDWIREHFQEGYYRDGLNSGFNIPVEIESYEIVIEGRIDGMKDYYGEYDEWVDVLDSKYRALTMEEISDYGEPVSTLS